MDPLRITCMVQVITDIKFAAPLVLDRNQKLLKIAFWSPNKSSQIRKRHLSSSVLLLLTPR